MTIRRYIAKLVSALAAAVFILPALAQEPTPQAVPENTFRDLGRVATNSKIQHTFILKNDGSGPLKIKNVQLSGRGLKAKLSQEIPSGEAGEIRLSVDVENLIGDWEWRISFQTNDISKREIRYTLQAYVYPPIEVAPSPAVFFSIFDDETVTKHYRVLNHTEQSMAIERMETLGSHIVAELKVEEEGKRFTLDITVPESVPPGRYREALLLRTNHPARPTIRVPVNVLVKTDIFVFPEAIGFGQVDQRQILNAPELLNLLTQTHTVTHRRGEFAITGIATDIPFLKIEKTPAGRSKIFNLDVGLDPEKLVPGRISGAITLQTDDPSFPEITVPVSGEIR